jgi:bifunctional N-acetylglucosamine-1-phosphate-uridyltransferase/glucosamine-1-phosphate-acetyltransferase GlmU-like protein
MLTTASFFDLSDFSHRALFGPGPVWETLKGLKAYMDAHPYPAFGAGLPLDQPLPETLVLVDGVIIPAKGLTIHHGDAIKGKLIVTRDGQPLAGASVLMAGAIFSGERISIGRGVFVEAGALIKSPAIIDDCSEIRQGAYLRGYCLVGQRCVVGHVTEVKHSIFLNDAKAGHFAYLGDSILGNGVNLGAGTKLANLRFTGGEVPVRTPAGTMATGLRKLGAIMADQVQTGCNSVTNPGTLLGKKAMLLPNTTAPSGYHPPNSLIKGR